MVFLICYNLLTLAKALYFCEHQFKNKKCQIVYRETVNSLKGIQVRIPIHVIPNTNKRYSSSLVKTIMDNIQTVKVIYQTENIVFSKKVLLNHNVLVVFKDDSVIEATLLDKIQNNQKLRNLYEIILVDEGTGLYYSEPKWEKLSFRQNIHKLINQFFSLSTYCISPVTQGLHPAIDKVVAVYPERVLKVKPQLVDKIVLQDFIFSPKYSQSFCELILGKKEKIIDEVKQCKMVYLTQPSCDPLEGLSSEDREREMKNTINLCCKKGKVLIKKHPRDRFSYSNIVNENVVLLPDKLNSLPFEVLYYALNKPLLITLCSSTVLNCDGFSILTYKIHKSQALDHQMQPTVEGLQHLFTPRTYEEIMCLLTQLL